jgi:hypothetical protein
MMKARRNQVLAGILIVQVVLCVVAFWPRPAASTGELLFPGVKSSDIVGLTITDADSKTVSLRQVQGQWVLPDADDYPADATKIGGFLDKLLGVTRRVVTSTAASHKQLKVAADDFVRRIDLEMGDGTSYRLYLGTSPRYNTTHLRVEGRDEAYLTGQVTSSDVQADASAWVDPLYLNEPATGLTGLTLANSHGVLSFTQDTQGAWSMAGLGPAETLDQDKLQSFLQAATAVRLLKPLGKTDRPEYGLDRPSAVLTLKTAAKDITLTVGAQDPSDSSYVVISSESPYYVRVTAATVQDLVGWSHADFLVPPALTPAPTPAPTPATTP